MGNEVRALSVIMKEVKAEWKKPCFGAVPYIEALSELNSIKDKYGMDDARSLVLYFLANSQTWRGDTARRIKAELKQMADVK